MTPADSVHCGIYVAKNSAVRDRKTAHRSADNSWFVPLTGATHEGMDADMAAALDQDQLSLILTSCDAQASPFQILFKFRMMDGSPLKLAPVACHRLADR
jgi:hypothetical protein